MNRTFRLIWNEVLSMWVPAAEIARGRRKRSRRAVLLLAMLGLQAFEASAGSPPPSELPSGGNVVAGAAAISQDGQAVLNVNQSTQRAIIDWDTFNVGSAAQVNFNQPGRDSATLNRVLDTNPSQILGNITANGQVFLTNPNGVYFGKSAVVDVGGLVATTHEVDAHAFMEGQAKLDRNGASGSITNEGSLSAALGGYVALLAPEVRNQGIVVAKLGTVAMASGEAFTLDFDGHHLAGITVEPSTIAVLVENKSAVIAPGGTIILSAKAADSLQGGVVRNSGTLEATGLSMKGGRIVLEASSSIENSGIVNANAGVDGSPAGSISISAPKIINSGSIVATAPGMIGVAHSGGSVELSAKDVEQTAAALIDVSAVSAGTVDVRATENVDIAGTIAAVGGAEASVSEGQGGTIRIEAGQDVTLTDALIDASAAVSGGRVVVQGGAPSAPSAPPRELPTVALLGQSEIRTSSRRGRGGDVTVTGERVGLFGGAHIDASGARGGGDVFVGGGFHGKDTSIDNASQVVIGRDATIDASATQRGDAGDVAVWADGYTTFAGNIAARGGAVAGDGGFVEVSGKEHLDFRGTVDASADQGKGGTLLLDPKNITVQSGGGASDIDVDQFGDDPSGDSTIDPTTIRAVTNTGTAITLQANNDITINSAIVTNNGGGDGGAMTFQAGRSITVNANIDSDDGDVSFVVNDAAAISANRDAGEATFRNNSLIDAGKGTVSITMGTGTYGDSGGIHTGQVTANTLTITHNGPTAGTVSGAIDLGEINVNGDMTIDASSARNVTNTIGTVIVRGTTTIDVGAGDVTVDRETTDFNTIGLTAGNVTLRDANAFRFGATALSGSLNATTLGGPMGSTGAVQVAGTTTLTASSGGFGYADPYIDLTNAGNDFGGAVTLSVADNGETNTGGHAKIRDANAITIASAVTASYLDVQAGASVTATTIDAGSYIDIDASGAVSLGDTEAGSNLSVTAGDAVTDSGTLTVPLQTTITAGADHDIILDSAGNNFGSIRIVSGRDVTLVDQNSINFGSSGSGATSHIYGDLHVTAAGDITQTNYSGGNGWSQITVDGATTFMANHASSPINLYLGPTDPFHGSNVGQANVFTGGVTLTRRDANTGFTNVQLRNTSATASVVDGLTSVGTLNNVFLRFDNAPSVVLPGMTAAALRVYAPSVANTAGVPTNRITQTGAITISGGTILAAASTGDIVLDDAGNDFNEFGIANSGARNVTVRDANAINLYANGYNQTISNDYNVIADGDITKSGNNLVVNGTASLNAGSGDISLVNGNTYLNILAVPAAKNVTVTERNSLVLSDISISGSLSLSAVENNTSLSQQAATSVVTGSPSTNTTTFGNWQSGISLSQSGNVLGNLAITNSGAVNIRENDAITQAASWTFNGTSGGTASVRRDVTLTTSDDQAITLDQNGNVFGDLTITQINNGSSAPGNVYIRETGDSYYGMTQSNAWTVHGTTRIDTASYSIKLDNADNIFGPLQVTGGNGLTAGQASAVTIYARSNGTVDAITDAGAGAWTAGTGAGATVRLVAYDGGVAGAGDVDLTNAANVLGDLYVNANNATITENDSITDGASTAWFTGATGWVTRGTTNLIVANPSNGRTITLDNLTNQIGPLGVTTTGAAGTLGSVLITDNTNLTQASAWRVGGAEVTLDARSHQIDLSTYDNVLGDIFIESENGMPTSVSIAEDDAITQTAAAWTLTAVPITLVAKNGNAITLANANNVLGDLSITGGAVSIRENDNITQSAGASGAWTTTGTTTLDPTAGAITLTNTANVLGDIAIAGTSSSVSITENDDITQASAWVRGASPFALNAGAHDILLTQSGNELGELTLTAQNASVTESHAGGIIDGGAWTIPGLTTLTAGTNVIVLDANPASDFGTVRIVSASNVDIADANGLIFDTSTASGTMTVTAGGEITQIGAITAPSLRLIGTGYATLTNVDNEVGNLAAGFSGGALDFVNSGDLTIAPVGGTSGVTIGANDVTLRSVNGTIDGLSLINASSTALDLTTGTTLVLPQMNIAGPQTYTGSTVSGTGITLTGHLTSTATGAITFNSPVTLGADLAIQTTNSAVDFTSTLAGATNRLTINAGNGLVSFVGEVSNLGASGDGSVALDLTSGGATFNSTFGANNGITVTGPVTFLDSVTLADGNVGSLFTGLVTLGRAGGMNLSGYDTMRFTNGVLLQHGPAVIDSNDSALTFEAAGSISGPFGLTLNSGTAMLTGLDRLGANLTSLDVTALNPTIPSGGISIAGPQTYTATNGSSISIDGDVTSTAAGAITFNSPVSVGASASVSSTDSAIVFAGTVDGAHDLTIDSGSGTKTFGGAVGETTALGDGTGAALILQGSGATTFNGTVETRSGMTAEGDVTFNDDVTLGDGDTGSTFSSLVTTGGTDGNSISGHDGMTFDGGLALVGGPVSVTSHGSTIAFGAAVSGPRALTLNALASGAGTVTGLQHIGFNSDLTALDITAHTLSLPSTGLAIAGPMSFTAAGGITLNGAVGNNGGPPTGAIAFNGPVLLATDAIVVTTDDADVSFNGTVDGAQSLTVNAGSGTTTFVGAVGSNTALDNVTTDAGGTTKINGGSIRTSGAQTYNDAVTLGADATLTGIGVSFGSTLDGAHALAVDDSGATVFGGVVGGSTSLTSITTDAPGTVVVNTTAVTTSGSQTYNENMTLGEDVVFTGNGLSFEDIDGTHTLTMNAGSGALQVNGAVGATTPVTSYTASGNTIAANDVTTSGTQSYTAAGGVTLNGDLTTTNSAVTIAGPTTLSADAVIQTGGGNITFAGATSTIDGAHELTLAAGAGDVVLGGVVGGAAELAGIDVSGNDLTLPAIHTVGDANQTYTALNDITLNQSRTLNAPIAFNADADGDGAGSFILLNGVSLTASNNTLTIQAADLDLQGNSTLSSGIGLMTIVATNDRNIALGGSDAAGQLTISGSELSRISSSGGLDLDTTGTGWIRVNGISAGQSQNITGTLGLNAQGTGDVEFVGAASTFNAVRANAAGGDINVGVDLTTTNDAIDFDTGVHVSGASTIASGGGNINFASTLDVDNDLTISTGNGVLTFGGAVGSNRTLTLNLGGGSVSGLGQLQSTLTGLTVNATAGITLPAFAINGPQVYNTGPITVTGDLAGVGIAFNDVVDVVPGTGSAITIDSRTGALVFDDLASFNAVDMTLTGDEIDFSRAVTGSGHLVLQPYTASRDVALGGGAPIAGLNLTAAELAWLPIGTLAGLTIGSGSGTGTLDVAGAVNASGIALTLNGGGGITQSGGSITSDTLSLYAAGNAISLTNGANAFGAVGISGAPSSVHLVNSLAISQLGADAWNLDAANVTLDAGENDITLTNAGNTFGTLALTGRNAQVMEAAATDIGASVLSGDLSIDSAGALHVSGALEVTGNVSLASTGTVTQSAPLTIGGNLDVVTTVNAGDVTLNNTGASATTIGDTRVGGNYVLTATDDAVSQAAGTSLQVRGDVTIAGSSIVLGGAGNVIGGTTTLPSTTTAVVRQSGVITLGNRTETGNLTVISERTNRSFTSGLIGGDAIVLDNAGNAIGGRISVSASAPTVSTGADVQTGINQAAGTSISVAGVASFTAESSSAGSLGIDLSNAGNHFGVLQLSGNTINVRNSAADLTTIQSALATTSFTLETNGAVVQTGAITAPTFDVSAHGAVTLTNVANDVGTLSIDSGGTGISYVDANSVAIAGIEAGGAAVSLTAGGTGNLTQTGALSNVGSLSANAGGAVTLTNAGNTIDVVSASSSGADWQLFDSDGGVTVSGIVRASTGDVSLRTAGDLTLVSGGSLEAEAGDVIASTEGAGNFINNSGPSALVVGSGRRWLVYSSTPDLASGAHTVKGGLTSSFRHYGVTYGSYAPDAVLESGNGFIYSAAAPILTVSAIVTGAASHIYGDSPTGTLDVSISSGLIDSEDDLSNIITGGTATFDTGLSNMMNAGSYSILYTGGLTSNYTLVADTTGASYTVTPATLTYVADTTSRVYGSTNPSLSGTIVGFKLGEDESVLNGSAVWTTTADASSNVGQYAIAGSGYAAGGNYVFAQAAGNATALAVTPADLTVTVNDDTKIYDGLGYSGGAGVTFRGFVNGDNESALGGTLSYGGTSQGARNAGTYVLSASGLTASNYDITYVNGELTIDRANLTITANDVVKTYDGTLAAAGTAAVAAGSQLFGSDSLSGGSFAFTNANAGLGNKTVTVSGVTVNDGNGGNNYNVSYENNTTSTINPASIVVSTSDVTKVYDGTLAANGSAIIVSGALFNNASNGGVQDSLSGGTFAFTDKNVGIGNRSVTTSGVTVNDGNGGGNYIVSYADNTTSTINPATLTFSGTIASKEYDGTTDATVESYVLSGFIGTETVSANIGSAAFVDKNAGVGKAVTVTGISLRDGANGGLASNYVIAPTASAVGNIEPKLLTLNVVVDDKVYDGTTNATLRSYGLSGFVGSETVTGVYTGSASFSDKNVGSNKSITITGIDLVNGTNGGLASNYAIPTAADSSASITPAPLNVAGVFALDKIYDGTTTAYLNTDAATVTGRFGSDDVHIGSIAGTFLDKNVGADKEIRAGTVVLGGVDAGNYVLIQPTNLTADITPRPLVVTASGIDKVYDGTTDASVSLSDDRIAGDLLTVTSTSAFLDKNAGVSKYVRVSNIEISGEDADNYVVNGSTSTFADIDRAQLAVDIVGIDKVYDGTTDASVTLSGSPLVGDDVQLVYGSAAFADKNVGVDKAITVSGISALGADASNYAIASIGTTTADITPAALTIDIAGIDKVYDGTTDASVILSGSPLAGDDVELVFGSAAFADKNAGADKAITVSGISARGADASNYTIANVGTTTADITPAALTVEIAGIDKVYDGTTDASVALSGSPLAGDDVELVFGSAAFADKNAGADKAITVSGISARGADASNYTLVSVGTATADITPAVLTVGAIGLPKSVDGSASARVALTDDRLTGDDLLIEASDAVFDNASVGTGKVITVTGIEIVGGADRANYILANTSTTTTGDITGEESTTTGTWPLPPTLPTPIPPTSPTSPPQVLDPTLPPVIGGDKGGSGTIEIDGPGSGGSAGTTSVGSGSSTGGGTGNGAGTGVLGTGSGTGTGSSGSDGTRIVDGANTAGGMDSGTSTSAPGAGDGSSGGSVAGSDAEGSVIGSNTTPDGSSAMSASDGGGSSSGGASSTGEGMSADATTSGATPGDAAKNDANAGTSSASKSSSEGDPTSGSSGEKASEGVTISIVRAPIGTYPGLVSVRVPRKVAASGSGFTFALPKALAEAEGADEVVVTLVDGKPLPSWLRYVPATKTFIATTPPAGALPIDVAVQIGDQRWIMTISEQAS